MTAPFCSICTGDGGGAPLVRSEDGTLECHRCRTSHPREGGYSFEGGRPERISNTDGNYRTSRFTGKRTT